MATPKSNRLTLKIGVVFDRNALLKETAKAQKELEGKFSESVKRQTKAREKGTNAIKKTNTELKKQGSLLSFLSGGWKGLLSKAVQFFVITQVMLAITTAMRRAVTLAVELDTAFTNLAIVSKATASEIAGIDKQISSMTKQLGILKKEVIDTVTEFSRAGFSIQESLLLAENAIKGANVGATSLSNVTTFLIAGLKSFNLEAEESARILDVLFRTANTTAINLEGIGEAFLRSANTLATAGASLEESAGLIASANESIQDPAKVGTALKTIASRLRGISTNGEAVPKLAKDFKALNIDLQNADGSFRGIFDIFQDLSKVYDTLDDITKESLLEKIAGKRQKNILIGLLSNFDTAEQAVKDALNSAGEVARANEKYLESLQGRANVAKESWNQLLQSFINTDFVKIVVTAFGKVAQALTLIIDKAPIIIGAIAGISMAIFGLSNPIGITIIAITGLSQVFKLFGNDIAGITERVDEYTNSIKNLESEISNLKGIENKTEAQKKYLTSLEDELALNRELKTLEEGRLIEARAKESEKAYKKINSAIEETARLQKLIDSGNHNRAVASKADTDAQLAILRDFEITLKKQQAELAKSNTLITENSDEYKANELQITNNKIALEAISKAYTDIFGIALTEATTKTEDQNDVLIKSVSLYKQIRDLINTTSDEYQTLSDALLQIEQDGYLTNDMVNTLVDTYGGSIVQTGFAKDAFREFVESNRIGRIEEIKGLKAVAQAEIITAKTTLEALNAVNIARGTTNELFENQMIQASDAIRNAEANILLLENEEKQLNATDEARAESLKSKTKEIKILTSLEHELLKVNNQIDMQNKLLARTDIPEEQIKIKENLIELYKTERGLLLEQQIALDEQNKEVVKGTEAYDDYIQESYKLSSAIEETTNSIYSATKAISDLNKEISDTRLTDLRKRLTALVEESSNNLLKSAELEAKSIEKKIEALEIEHDAKEKILKIARETFDFNKKIADFNKKINAKESEAEMLKLDNSLESQRRRAVLAEELAELEVEKKDEVDDYSRVLEDRRIEESYQKGKDVLEKRLKDQEEFIDEINDNTSKALSNIEEELSLTTFELENIMSLFAQNIGTALTENIGGAFDGLSVKGNSFLGLLDNIANKPSGSGSDGGRASRSKEESIKAQMQANGAKWEDASETEREDLNKANIDLASQIGYKYDKSGIYIPNVIPDSESYSSKYKNRLKYDNGGKLEKGDTAVNKEQNSEWVLTDENLMSIFENGLSKMFSVSSPALKLDGLNGGETKVDKLINIENMNNTLSDDVDVARLGENMAQGSKNKLSSYGYKF